ncbi:hypothetical protein LS482_14250 [Sinomicrobium kalidii]|uniref:terpene synthase family protein n=1 Tax=Sinomicrobium kalidii TaxID=2900738 RepID=UPI001E431A81|nr:hypothetical protein [Sinomicrobium kalidii]UGU14852.1 hypothetical protein LS482_14250 [Sinomicrobium kalidii]
MKITIPKPYWPYPSVISPHAKEAHEHNMQWLQQHNLLPDKSVYDLYERQYYAYMAARMYPMAEKEVLFALADFCALLFIVDDDLDKQAERKVAGVDGTQALEAFISTGVTVMKNRKKIAPEAGKEAFSALADCFIRLCAFSDKTWQDKIIQSFADTFTAAVWEMKNVIKGYCPTLEEYMKYRPFFSGTNLAVDLSLVAAAINLPEAVMQHPAIQRLMVLSRNLVCWANDMFSLSKEMDQNNADDKHNLVYVMQKRHDVTFEEAILKASAFHDEQAREFIALSSDLPVFGKGLDSKVSRYIDALICFVKGNIDWSEKETTRYAFSYSE